MKHMSEFEENVLYLAFLSICLGAFMGGYFVWRKVSNDSRIAIDTKRIADVLEAKQASASKPVGISCSN